MSIITKIDKEIFKLAESYIKEEKIEPIYSILSKFVHQKTTNRAKSHNFEHMKKVALYSIYIAKKEKETNQNNLYQYILIAAWFHDLLDHKYNDIKKSDITTFLKDNLLGYDADLIFKITERVSYTREIKFKSSDWDEELGAFGIKIRNIVSDADKLDTIGISGINRCRLYTKEINPGISDHDVNKNILKYAGDKMLRIREKFIKSKTAKDLAAPLHNKMVVELKKIKSQSNV